MKAMLSKFMSLSQKRGYWEKQVSWSLIPNCFCLQKIERKKAQLRSSENVQSIKSTATDVVSLLHDDESSHGPVMDYFFLAGVKIPVSP